MSEYDELYKNMTSMFRELNAIAKKDGIWLTLLKLRLNCIREEYWHWWDIKHKIEYRNLLKEIAFEEMKNEPSRED